MVIKGDDPIRVTTVDSRTRLFIQVYQWLYFFIVDTFTFVMLIFFHGATFSLS
jgi:hypothetical protein